MATECKTCEVEITGIEKMVCRSCASAFHRSCIDGLNRTAFEAIGKFQKNCYWLCDGCAGRFDQFVQSMDVDEDSGQATDVAKLSEAVDKLSGIVTELSGQLKEKKVEQSYANVVYPGSKREREDDEEKEPPAKVKPVCGTRTIQHQIKTVVSERDLFWVYLGRLDPCHTDLEIAEMTQECLELSELPKVRRLVKKDADISKLSVVSYRVLLPDDLRDVALQADTWPTGVAVREFDFDLGRQRYVPTTEPQPRLADNSAFSVPEQDCTFQCARAEIADLPDHVDFPCFPVTITPFITANHRSDESDTSGRTHQGSEECPRPPYSVESSQRSSPGVSTSHQSRPDPVYGHGSGGFRPPPTGEYNQINDSSPTLNHQSLQQSKGTLSFITVYYQNAGGMRTKTKQFFLALASSDYDVIALSETWLQDDIVDAELSSNYNLFRQDRNELTSDRSRGGGVLIAVKKAHDFTCTRVLSAGYEHLEQVAVRIKARNHTVYVCCIYIRPNSPPDVYTSHGTAVQELVNLSSNDDSIIVTGDYNLPHLAWTFDVDVNGFIPLNASTEQELALTENVVATGLLQICSLANVNGRILDLAFVNDTLSVELIEPPKPILRTDRHHKPFILRVDFPDIPGVATRIEDAEPDFSRCDFDRVTESLSSIDWDDILQDQDSNTSTTIFYDVLYEIVRQFVPSKRVSRNRTEKLPWWNADLRNRRNILRKAQTH
ncbi:hypothetical protein pipiens_005162 [Culex pipiens pipiens]|uniref:Endonuclease/exonuclease/phosphatase domain-containing protein n=1 Tax=Culex pipiens pipiens TaxID=38569 RepID=A0ABD1CAV0_CULPP